MIQTFGAEAARKAPAAVSLEPLNLQEIFGNANPLEVEIGCGKAKFITARAMEAPERNFLGLDRVGRWMKRAQRKKEKNDLGNLRLLKVDAREILYRLPAASVSVFHIYFPDPWNKRRHQKRRLLGPVFFRLLHARLEPKGLLEVATDVRDYFEAIKGALHASGVLWSEERESMGGRFVHPHLKTNYELKFEAAGRPLYYMELQK